MNKKILESSPAERELFDILVLSNNSPESGVRIINSAKHYGKGDHPWGCLIALGGCRAHQAPPGIITGRERARGHKGMGGRGSLGAQLPSAMSFTPGSLAAFCIAWASSGSY